MQVVQTKYRTLIELAPDAVFLIDMTTGRITETNECAADLLGRPTDALVGASVATVHPAAEAEQYLQRFQQTIEEGSVQFSTLPDGSQAYVETAEGDLVPVEIHARGLELEGTMFVYGLVRDITERLERERDLKEKNERLERFATLVAHDLRNPLTVANGFLDLLYETGERHHYERIDSAHGRIEDIITDLLTLAREDVEALDAEQVSLRDEASNAWASCDTDAATLHVEESAEFEADRSQLAQLLENLLSNAVRHGGEGVSVRVGLHDDGFYVADDGPGIPEAERESVFEAGFTTSESGTGFGLLVVRTIAEAHGWAVSVTESETGGARFEVTGVEFAG